MCGIAGILSLNPAARVDADMLRKMTDLLTHRGPDDGAIYTDNTGTVALGFRRLSIIDLQTGMQPITNENRDIHVVCNGEIYNFQSLRTGLSRQGHQFSTAGDIEPIVHLYEEHGAKFLDHLDGFFSLALYDEQRRRLTLAVDRVGKKPLYYTTVGEFLYFASELKALRPALREMKLDKNAMVDYLRFGYIPAPGTIFEGVQKLPPGHMFEISLDYQQRLADRVVPPSTAYDLPVKMEFEDGYREAGEQLNTLLTRAIEKRLVADVPLGVLLSGGIDSSIVTAVASRLTNRPLKTFSVGFKSELYNELPLAGLVARKYRTEHTEFVVEPEIDTMLDLVASVYDEPFADSSAIPTALICREAARHVRVVLTGDGGDEAFCGYDRYRGFALGSLLPRLNVDVGPVRAWCSPGGEMRSRQSRVWRFIRSLPLRPGERYAMLMRVHYEEQLQRLAGPELGSVLNQRVDFVARTLDSLTELTSPIAKVNRCDIMTYLPGDLLVKIDRASMASSLETRSPFLDRYVLAFGASLPVRYKVGPTRGKRILRDTFGHLLPEELFNAPKRGFGVPMGQWLRGPLKEQMSAMLGGKSRIVQGGFVESAAMGQLIQEHLVGQHDHAARLWSLMVLEKFLMVNQCGF